MVYSVKQIQELQVPGSTVSELEYPSIVILILNCMHYQGQEIKKCAFI